MDAEGTVHGVSQSGLDEAPGAYKDIDGDGVPRRPCKTNSNLAAYGCCERRLRISEG